MVDRDQHIDLRERFFEEVKNRSVLPEKYAKDPTKLLGLLDRADSLAETLVHETRTSRLGDIGRKVGQNMIENALRDAAQLHHSDEAFAELLVRYIREKVDLTDRLGPTQKWHDFFICHSFADKEFARRLAGDLGEHGYRVWFDEFKMLPGDSLYEKIQEGIKNSSWFVIVLSEDSVSSKWCKRELHNAMEIEFDRSHVYVVPVLCRDCTIPGFLREKLWADCRGSAYESGLEQVLERLRVGLN